MRVYEQMIWKAGLVTGIGLEMMMGCHRGPHGRLLNTASKES